MGIFDINKTSIIFKEKLNDSNIYYIDNFFKNPDNIVDFLYKSKVSMHTPFITEGFKSYNGIHFYDMRIDTCVDEVIPVYEYLCKISNKSPYFKLNKLMTNHTRFINTNFNDYENNYWYPHKDDGYTAIIYLNKDDEECGTNIYENIKIDEGIGIGEHVKPWRSKENWKIIKTIKPKYNRCVIFNGKKFDHGMNITNNKYFGDEFRTNMVFFFKSD